MADQNKIRTKQELRIAIRSIKMQLDDLILNIAENTLQDGEKLNTIYVIEKLHEANCGGLLQALQACT